MAECIYESNLRVCGKKNSPNIQSRWYGILMLVCFDVGMFMIESIGSSLVEYFHLVSSEKIQDYSVAFESDLQMIF